MYDRGAREVSRRWRLDQEGSDTPKLKNNQWNSVLTQNGGVRPGAGRPNGRSSPAMLEMKATFEEIARKHAPEALEILRAQIVGLHDADRRFLDVRALGLRIALYFLWRANPQFCLRPLERGNAIADMTWTQAFY